MILLDTGVVSAALRRRRRGPLEERLTARVRALLESDFAVALPGIVFQEVLSGIGEEAQHRRLLAAIRDSFPIFLATEGDHLRAAELVTASAGGGIALSTADALIAAQALGRGAGLFTTDRDFDHLHALAGLEVIHG
jgi:predicted nucleic acid-binding protein